MTISQKIQEYLTSNPRYIAGIEIERYIMARCNHKGESTSRELREMREKGIVVDRDDIGADGRKYKSFMINPDWIPKEKYKPEYIKQFEVVKTPLGI